MQVSVESVGKLERKLTVKFPVARLDTQVKERIHEMSRTVRLKGFRPGKVPVAVVQQRFGTQVRDEVLSDLIGSTLREAIEQEKLRPAVNPEIDITGQPDNGEIAYTAIFEVMPEFPEIEVATLQINRVKAEVGEADIDQMVETLREQRRTVAVVERESGKGDLVVFDYAAQADDYRFPAQGLERAVNVLGSGHGFAAWDEVLTGHKADDAFEAWIDFPADFRDANLAGKKAQVNFKIISVHEPQLPEVNADFIKLFGVGEGDLEAFRGEIRANLERELQSTLLARLKTEVATKLADAYPQLDVPHLMVQAEARALAAAEMPRDQSPSQEQIDAVLPTARRRVIIGLLMGEIARKQALTVDSQRLAKQLAAIASTYEEPGKVIELYRSNPQLMSELRNRVMEDQVAEWVADHAKTTDQVLSFDEVMRPSANTLISSSH